MAGEDPCLCVALTDCEWQPGSGTFQHGTGRMGCQMLRASKEGQHIFKHEANNLMQPSEPQRERERERQRERERERETSGPNKSSPLDIVSLVRPLKCVANGLRIFSTTGCRRKRTLF